MEEKKEKKEMMEKKKKKKKERRRRSTGGTQTRRTSERAYTFRRKNLLVRTVTTLPGAKNRRSARKLEEAAPSIPEALTTSAALLAPSCRA